MKKMINILGFAIFIILWVKIITFLFSNPFEPEYPSLRARFGTIMHHSSDALGKAHVYCYYPKAEAQTNLVIKRQDDADCSKWYGKIIFYEGWYVSEREKHWWSENQYIKDCGNCEDSSAVEWGGSYLITNIQKRIESIIL